MRENRRAQEQIGAAILQAHDVEATVERVTLVNTWVFGTILARLTPAGPADDLPDLGALAAAVCEQLPPPRK